MKRKNEDFVKEKRSKFGGWLRREEISFDFDTLNKVFLLLIHLASFLALERVSPLFPPTYGWN